MVVITGTGRSGTTLLARLYQELGYNVGGGEEWWDEADAGLEPADVNELNLGIMRQLALPSGFPGKAFAAKIWRFINKLIPKGAKRGVTETIRNSRIVRNNLILNRYSDISKVAEQHKDEIISISKKYEVAKSPTFARALPVWIEAGADIDHVIISARDVESVTKSQERAGFLRYDSFDMGCNHYALLAGMCLSTVVKYDVSFTIMQFPKFVEDHSHLYENLFLSKGESFKNIDNTFSEIADLNKVNFE